MTKKFRSIKSMRAKSRGRKKRTVNIGKVFREGGTKLFRSSARVGRGVTNLKPKRRPKMAKVATFTERR